MKKVLVSFLLAFCMLLAAGCGTDASEELSSVHLESSAKTPAATEEIAQDASDEVVEHELAEALVQPDSSTDEGGYDEQLAENESYDVEVYEEPEQETMVWIPRSGSKYHSSEYCSNMKDPSRVTLSEAERRGFEPCKKCY